MDIKSRHGHGHGYGMDMDMDMVIDTCMDMNLNTWDGHIHEQYDRGSLIVYLLKE
jgi:hypothetical protein